MHPEPVLTPEIETKSVLRNVVTAIAATLAPSAMLAFPPMSTALLPCAIPLPAALPRPSPLPLPRDCLLLRTLRLLWLPGLLGTLFLLLLRPLLLGLLDPLLLLRPLLLGLLDLLLLLRPLLLGLLDPLLLLRLSLRALLLCRRPRTLLLPILLPFGLALLFVLLAVLRVRRDTRPEKQKQGSGTGRSKELHSCRLR